MMCGIDTRIEIPVDQLSCFGNTHFSVFTVSSQSGHQVPTYYTYCKAHRYCGKHCRKDIQINRPNKDVVIRKLKYWLCAGALSFVVSPSVVALGCLISDDMILWVV